MCLKYEVTFALNHSGIGKHSERIRKITPFKDQCEWKEMKFLTGSKDWEKFERKKKQSFSMFSFYQAIVMEYFR